MSYREEYSPEFDGAGDLTSAYSIASTAHDLVIEYGRRYPNYRFGSQHFPRGDEMASENEKALHNLMLHMHDNNLFKSAIEDPKNVLDVRCGQHGLWAKNMADRYPDAQVTGFDVFMPDNEGRQNLEFILQSYNDIWIVDEIIQQHGLLDFVYAKGLFAGSRDYPQFYRQCFDHLKPGGHFEQTEVDPRCQCDDGVFREDSIVRQLCRLEPALDAAMASDYTLATNMRRHIEDAGFVDIEEHVDILPWGPWKDPITDQKGHESGRCFMRFYETGIQGWLMAPCVKHLKTDPDEVNRWCEAAILELKENDQHWFSPVVTVTAKRPPA